MPRGKPPVPPEDDSITPTNDTHLVSLTSNQSRILGLLWDKYTAEMAGRVDIALQAVESIFEQSDHIRQQMNSVDEWVDFLASTKEMFDNLWDVHGCACTNPDCPNRRKQPPQEGSTRVKFPPHIQ